MLLVLAVVPGAVFTWAFERENAAFGSTLSDRVLRFFVVSLCFQLLLSPAEWLLAPRRADIEGAAAFARVWGLVAVVTLVPALVGTVEGGLYATRSSRMGWSWVRRMLSAQAEARVLRVLLGRTPAPRAWDHLFSERPSVYVRVRLDDDTWLAGRFASASYAGGFPHETDLYLEEGWDVDQGTGELIGPGTGFPVYLPARTMKWIDVIPEAEEEITDDE